MQGNNNFTPCMFVNFNLSDHIAEYNFYRVLKTILNLRFIKKKTQFLYSRTGWPGIDPIVFFKCKLIGYFENICSDISLERQINTRLDLRFFIDHDIDETNPDHSSFCRIRIRIHPPSTIYQQQKNITICTSLI